MKQHWELDELIEHWTLLPGELTLLARKSDTNRLGVAVLLKYFQHEAQFPLSPNDIPSAIVDYIASQVGVPARKFLKYRWDERSMQRHRTEIRDFLGIRKATVQDAQEMTDWLVEHVLPQEMNVVHLKVEVEKRFQALKVEPPTPGRVERIIHSAIRTYETRFFEATLNKLSDNSRTQIDALLKTSETAEDNSAVKPSLFHTLNSEPGRVSLNSFLDEIAKLDRLRQVALTDDLFKQTSPKVLQTYATRAATEPPRELRGHPEPIRYTLVAAFCWLRTQVVTDNLVDLLIQMIHGIGSRAERRVEAQLMKEFKRVSGKYNLLYQIANASLEEPDGIVKDVIYPVVDEQTLKDLVKELKTSSSAYQQKVHTVIRASYSRHYRRILPKLLSALTFRSNNDVHRPVIQALELLKKYADSNQQYYSADDSVPIEGVIKSSQRDILIEEDSRGNKRINRINYEICVLQALRERLRCKEIWVVGANRYRNPEEDLPTDFEQQREAYYQALKQPTEVEDFIQPLKQAMEEALQRFNDGLPKNPKVEILKQKKGSIRLSPLEKRPDPPNILTLKTDLIRRWPMTNLLDILKEADLRIGFTNCFKSLASREALDRATIQKRLLLCLYGLGTNTGLKRVSNGTADVSFYDLRYIKRRFVQKEAIRQAITEVVNAIFRVRSPQIWGEGTTTCASDSKKFGS